MPSRGTQRPGTLGICGNTVSMVNAICDRGACFPNRWPTSEKLNATFFAAATPPCKPSGERMHGILRDDEFVLRYRLECGPSSLCHIRDWNIPRLLRSVCHEIKAQLRQQGF